MNKLGLALGASMAVTPALADIITPEFAIRSEMIVHGTINESIKLQATFPDTCAEEVSTVVAAAIAFAESTHGIEVGKDYQDGETDGLRALWENLLIYRQRVTDCFNTSVDGNDA